jgi:hypothetical protein
MMREEEEQEEQEEQEQEEAERTVCVVCWCYLRRPVYFNYKSSCVGPNKQFVNLEIYFAHTECVT